MNDLATPPDKWLEVIGINLNACYYMCHGVLSMLKQDRVRLLASISGMVGMHTAHTYCSAKGG